MCRRDCERAVNGIVLFNPYSVQRRLQIKMAHSNDLVKWLNFFFSFFLPFPSSHRLKWLTRRAANQFVLKNMFLMLIPVRMREKKKLLPSSIARVRRYVRVCSVRTGISYETENEKMITGHSTYNWIKDRVVVGTMTHRGIKCCETISNISKYGVCRRHCNVFAKQLAWSEEIIIFYVVVTWKTWIENFCFASSGFSDDSKHVYARHMSRKKNVRSGVSMSLCVFCGLLEAFVSYPHSTAMNGSGVQKIVSHNTRQKVK